jgi:hypothetical protein
MSSPCALTGGAFQDSEGNLLVDGYLLCYLSQDASVNGNTNVCAGIAIRIQLDASGDAASGSFLWGNDVLSPANTYYRVTAYTAKGQPAWGPNNQQVAGSSFDIGTWIPNQVISWTPSTSAITLENNGTLNSSQNLLNIESTDSSVVITDEGGGSINLQAAVGKFDTAGQNFFFGAGIDLPTIGYNVAAGNLAAADQAVYVFGFNLDIEWVLSTASYISQNSGSSDYYGAGIYDASGNALIRTSFLSGNIVDTVGTNTFTPVSLPAGFYYFAQAVDGTGLSGPSIDPLGLGGAFTQTQFYQFLNANNLLCALAANPMGTNTGVMPATLGSLTALTTQAISMMMIKWTP